MQKMIKKPTPPAENQCCGGGCQPCVWDRYYDALHQWQAQQEAEGAQQESAEQ